MKKSDIQELLSADTVLIAAYWALWIAVFALASAQLLYLFQGYGDWTTAIGMAIPATAMKYFIGQQADQTPKLRNQLQAYRSFAKNAMAWAGPQIFEVKDTSQLDEGLAYGVVIEATVGFEEYNDEPPSGYSRQLVGELLPSELNGYLGHVKELEKIDQYLKYVSERIDGVDTDGLLHDIRTIVLKDVFALTRNTTEIYERHFSSALEVLRMKADKTPPIRALIWATKREYDREDSRQIEIGTWEIVASWMKTRPPKTFDDLCGESGMELPKRPIQPVGKTYFS